MVNLDKYYSIFIANWKLNGNSSFLKDYYEKLKVNSNNCTIICSPSIYLKSLKANNENLFCGAQDVSFYKEGAYTGELSASMLKDNNINFSLTIAGYGSETENLIRKTKQLGLSDFVEFTGRYNYQTLPKLLSKFDLFISTSLSDAGLASVSYTHLTLPTR